MTSTTIIFHRQNIIKNIILTYDCNKTCSKLDEFIVALKKLK